MRKFSAALIIIMTLCPCACASISRDAVESSWAKITEAYGLGKPPVSDEKTALTEDTLSTEKSASSTETSSADSTPSTENSASSTETSSADSTPSTENSAAKTKTSSPKNTPSAEKTSARKTVTARKSTSKKSPSPKTATLKLKSPEPITAEPVTETFPEPTLAGTTMPEISRRTPPRPTPKRPSPVLVSERLTVRPGGVLLEGARSYRGAIMSAYQRAYAMNFEIWKPADLPAGWYATFDGFPVAQVAENRWVYGQMNTAGTIQPTNILVGSVIPARVPGLARISAVWSWGKNFDSPEFLRIRTITVNRMGWLNTEYLNTLIAWNTHRPGVYIWLGDRWKRFEPNSGEYTYQMIKRLSPWIASELRRNHAWFYGGEPLEAADLARQWGFIWAGRVVIENLRTSGTSGSGGSEYVSSGTTTSLQSETGTQSEPTTPPEPQQNEGQWDVD